MRIASGISVLREVASSRPRSPGTSWKCCAASPFEATAAAAALPPVGASVRVLCSANPPQTSVASSSIFRPKHRPSAYAANRRRHGTE